MLLFRSGKLGNDWAFSSYTWVWKCTYTHVLSLFSYWCVYGFKTKNYQLESKKSSSVVEEGKGEKINVNLLQFKKNVYWCVFVLFFQNVLNWVPEYVCGCGRWIYIHMQVCASLHVCECSGEKSNIFFDHASSYY